MSPFFQTFKSRPPLAIIIMAFSMLLLPVWLLPKKACTSPFPVDQKGLAEKIRMIKLYTVHEGKCVNRLYGPEELRHNPIQVEGYVTGVLVLANVEMNIKVDGQTTSKIRKNGDGTYSIKYYGKVSFGEIGEPSSNNNYYRKTTEGNEGQSFMEGYSLFPRVIGDCVSPSSSFRIALEGSDFSWDLSVRQMGYSTFPEKEIEFQYLGDRLEKHLQNPEFDQRLNAVYDGIRSVERAFRAQLVGKVKILDYEKIQNAVTCEEKNDIWFYIHTFLNEPIAELKTIAEHETLHILVDENRLAKDLSLRELFSDLKGYDTLSRERFSLITRGVTSPEGLEKDISKNEFFAFIDEKNFLQGMKGGHSNQNLDEFCTSFLHSLMFVDCLKENLERPLKLGNGEGTFLLKPKKRHQILATYIRTIETFLKAQPDAVKRSCDLRSFLEERLADAEEVALEL